MSKKLRADLILLAITVVWGASFPLMKMVLGFIPAYAYLSIRFLLAAVVLVLLFRKSLTKMNKRVLLYGCIIGLFMFGGMAFQVVGLYTTSASNSGFITGLNVVMVPVFAAVMLKKRPDRASFIGITIAFAGLFFLSGGLNFNFNEGDFLTFLCAICWAFQIICIDNRKRKSHHNRRGPYPTLHIGLSLIPYAAPVFPGTHISLSKAAAPSSSSYPRLHAEYGIPHGDKV